MTVTNYQRVHLGHFWDSGINVGNYGTMEHAGWSADFTAYLGMVKDDRDEPSKVGFPQHKSLRVSVFG